jgi:histidine triad (HIT) family protein
MIDKNCLFCQIGGHKEPAEIVWENEEFIAIKNKHPVAPVHVLVLPKSHVEKSNWVAPLREAKLRGAKLPDTTGEFWGKIMPVVFEVVVLLGLDKTGYKLVNNGAGYNHFEHEHIHILGGTEVEPGGST